MVGWHHWLNGHEFDQAPGVCDGQGSLECYSPWGRKELDMTEWLNWTNSIIELFFSFFKFSVVRFLKCDFQKGWWYMLIFTCFLHYFYVCWYHFSKCWALKRILVRSYASTSMWEGTTVLRLLVANDRDPSEIGLNAWMMMMIVMMIIHIKEFWLIKLKCPRKSNRSKSRNLNILIKSWSPCFSWLCFYLYLLYVLFSVETFLNAGSLSLGHGNNSRVTSTSKQP